MGEVAYLIGISGEYAGQSFSLAERETLIGRDEACDLQIIDARISRRHAIVRHEGNQWVLEDLDSTHGTFVKGERIQRTVLHHGETVTLGETILRFEHELSPDAVPTELASPDDVATVLESADAVLTEMPTPDDVATVMSTPDDVPTQLAEADDVATVLASNEGSGSLEELCSQCGAVLDAVENFCGECGAPRADLPLDQAAPAPPTRKVEAGRLIAPGTQPPAVVHPAQTTGKKSFPWKRVAIGGGVLAVVLIVGVGLVLLRGLFGEQGARDTGSPLTENDALALTVEASGQEAGQTAPLIPGTLTPTIEIQATQAVTEEIGAPTEGSPAEASPQPIGTGAGFGGSAQIAFASDRSGRPQIYLISVDTLEERQLTDVSGGACQPAWSSDGARLAYTSPCNTNREEYAGSSIFLLDVDPAGNPGSVTQLIATVGGGDYDPAWSRDGSRIAFTSWRTGRPQIFTVSPDGGDLRNLNDDLAFNWAPTWSNDGTQVAFLTGRGGQEEIWTVPTSGGEERRFSRSDGKDVARPDWSPDGTTIVFEKIVGNIPRLIAAPVADGGVRELQVCQEDRLSLQPMGEPTWSPDGAWLAFETWPDGVNHEIAVMQANCSEYTELTSDSGLDFDAAWRPVP